MLRIFRDFNCLTLGGWNSLRGGGGKKTFCLFGGWIRVDEGSLFTWFFLPGKANTNFVKPIQPPD